MVTNELARICKSDFGELPARREQTFDHLGASVNLFVDTQTHTTVASSGHHSPSPHCHVQCLRPLSCDLNLGVSIPSRSMDLGQKRATARMANCHVAHLKRPESLYP